MSRIILNNNAKVVKSFNNNILLVKENGKEKILFQKGIGFGRRPGDLIEKGIVVEKVFIIEDEDNQRNFNEILDRVDSKLIVLVEELIAEITDELGEELNENIHVGLTDHLFYAIRRLEDNEEIQNPFLVEIETLYGREFSMACRLANRIKEELGVEIPEGEKGFIALHIHSARNNGKLSNTIKYSFLSNSIIEHVEKRLEIKIDRKSLDYARFLTHIRFAIERIITNSPTKNDLIDVIKVKYRLSYKIARETKDIICKALDINSVSEDEVAYLAMYIERFRVAIVK
ncbi:MULTISPECIES: BglG family transcription antiterminator [unclassified Clostridium]|uniref:BglG family transcription antiterminator n=1 Tax=unclassified Clostridium TaxID=2614128 RepID=UPI0025C4B41E|nr:PRD domain-containing protein [Clostridium sp.]MCI6692353.1 PRD domain-containing protein [Clostridium sp.]MDY2630976.1 PRD domain-containing protein [Clostridium sp.]MDY4254013.1 PRD domain-containing protein [Clostridium sp.]MDY6226943.1 PRD domain-containing protein [Clostridium sp.]